MIFDSARKNPHLFVIIFVITVLVSSTSINAAYATALSTAFPAPPFRQLDDGIPLDAIECNAPRDLYVRDSNIPLCIHASTFEILLERGMNLAPHNISYTDMIVALNTLTDSESHTVKRIVEETINMYDADTDNAFANINMLSQDSVLYYPFVLDLDTGNVASHGASIDRVGDRSVVLGDYTDRPVSVILDELQDGGTWAEYLFLDPMSNEDNLKRSWLVLHDGYIFGAGYYDSIDEKINTVIDDAITLYESGGIAAINALDIVDVYFPFVVDYTTDTMVGFPANPDFIGTNMSANPILAKDLSILEIAEFLKEDKQVFRYFTALNPITGEDSQKRTSYKVHDTYVFGAGYNYPAEEKVANVVKRTIAAYDLDKDSAFADVNAQAESLDPHYPFVIDADSGLIVSHGAFPDVIGTPSIIFEGAADKSVEEIMTDLQDGSAWIKYTYPIPGTVFEETKRSYLQLHDGYVFGSGYYFSMFTVVVP